jgi:hypothetical protein
VLLLIRLQKCFLKAKLVVYFPVGIHLANGCVLTEHWKCLVFLLSLGMIKMELLEISLSVVGWIVLAQDRYRYSCCERGNKPSGSIKFW